MRGPAAAFLVVGLLCSNCFLSAVLATEASSSERQCGAQYLRQNAADLHRPSFKIGRFAQPDEEVNVGSQRDFLVRVRFPSIIPATARFVGKNCYVFVEDTQWDENGGPVLQQDVDFLAELFDSSTPADPTRGLFDLEVETFGEALDVDNDPRVYIVILQLDRSLLGLFDPEIATDPDPALRVDVIFMNSTVTASNQYAAGGTLAHELQHLIHWGQDEDEEIWLDEGLSGFAELIAGYPELDPNVVPAFLRRPGIDVTDWDSRAYNYGSTYLYVAFLAERFGIELMADLVNERRNGTDGVDATLVPFGQDFRATWADWIAANYASTDPLYGYKAIGERRATAIAVPPPPLPFERKGAAVDHQWGTTYVLFREAGSTEIEFFGDPNGRYVVQLFAMRGGSGDLESMVLDGGSRGRAHVANADSFVVIVGRTSSQGREFELSARRLNPVTSVAVREDLSVPLQVGLAPPFPNPFNSEIVLPFEVVGEIPDVVLGLYGILGNPVRTFHFGSLGPGTYRMVWDGTNDIGDEVASGFYFARLRTGSVTNTRSVTLVR